MERFRLTILAESRIRWKVYVRFGGEYWETYHRNMTRRRVLSLHNQALKSHSDTQVGIMQLCSIEEGSTEHDDSPDADQQAISDLEKYVTPFQSRPSGEKSWRAGKMEHKYKSL